MGNQESVVRIMVESPKDPPNVEFGVAFPQTTVVRQKTDPMMEPEQIDCLASSSVPDAIEDVQEPIDVNTPRDTTNIFYAYEDVEFNDGLHQITINDAEPTESNDQLPIISDVQVVDEQINSDNQADQLNSESSQSKS